MGVEQGVSDMKIVFYGEPKMERDEAGRYRRLAEHEVPV